MLKLQILYKSLNVFNSMKIPLYAVVIINITSKYSTHSKTLKFIKSLWFIYIRIDLIYDFKYIVQWTLNNCAVYTGFQL